MLLSQLFSLVSGTSRSSTIELLSRKRVFCIERVVDQMRSIRKISSCIQELSNSKWDGPTVIQHIFVIIPGSDSDSTQFVAKLHSHIIRSQLIFGKDGSCNSTLPLSAKRQSS